MLFLHVHLGNASPEPLSFWFAVVLVTAATAVALAYIIKGQSIELRRCTMRWRAVIGILVTAFIMYFFQQQRVQGAENARSGAEQRLLNVQTELLSPVLIKKSTLDDRFIHV